MLLVLLLLVVAMAFYRLAKKHRKPMPFGYAFLGIAVFIGTPLIVGTFLWLILSSNDASIDTEFTVVLWSLLAAVVSVIVFYYMLKRAWSKRPQKKINDDLLDQ